MRRKPYHFAHIADYYLELRERAEKWGADGARFYKDYASYLNRSSRHT